MHNFSSRTNKLEGVPAGHISVGDVVTPFGSLSRLFSMVAALEETSVNQEAEIRRLKLKCKKIKLMVKYAPGSQCYLDAKEDFDQLTVDIQHKD